MIALPLPDLNAFDIWQTMDILLGDGQHYVPALRIYGDASTWSIPSDPTIALEDWTADGTPDVVLDGTYSTSAGDIGLSGGYRVIVHCHDNVCAEVWRGGTWSESSAPTLNGTTQCQAEFWRKASNPDEFQFLATAFAFYGPDWVQCGDYSGDFPTSTDPDDIGGGLTTDHLGLRVLPKYLSTWKWDGTTFQRLDRSEYARPYLLAASQQLEAVSDSGVVAQVSVRNFSYIGAGQQGNDQCMLSVGMQSLGGWMGCKADFAWVEWADITGDGQAEVVLHLISGPRDPEGVALTDLQVRGATCPFERLLAYQVDEETASVIADVSGCIVQEDLFGVRVVQDASATRILAALSPSDATGDPGIDAVYELVGSSYVSVRTQLRK